MKSYRLNRLFNAKSGRCFDVAVDHGFFNEYGFLSGIENLGAAVATLAEAGPDAIQLTVGQSRFLQSLKGRHKPSLVLRTDVANVYGKELPRALFSRMIEDPVGQALRLDAACVVVNLFRIPNEPEVNDQCIQEYPEAQTRVRSLRYAADDRTARLPAECDCGRLHGGWRSFQNSSSRSPGGGVGRGYHQGRPYRRCEHLP